MTKNQVFWLFWFRGSWPTKGQWKFCFTKMGSSFPTKGQWKIFFAKMGSKIPTKGQWNFFFAKMGSKIPTKGRWKIFFAKMGSKIPTKGRWKTGLYSKWGDGGQTTDPVQTCLTWKNFQSFFKSKFSCNDHWKLTRVEVNFPYHYTGNYYLKIF